MKRGHTMKKFSDYSTDELRKISRKGGINSGKARRRKKQLSIWAVEFLKVLEANNYGKNNETNISKHQLRSIEKLLGNQDFNTKRSRH